MQAGTFATKGLKWVVCFLVHFLVISSLVVPASAQPKSSREARTYQGHASKKDMYVSVGKPRHWTLDDAHYLLARLHGRTRDINIKSLGELDPNAFNSTRIRQLEEAFAFSLKYNQADALKNEIARDKYETDLLKSRSALAQESKLLDQRDRLRREKAELAAQLAEVDLRINSLTAQQEFQTSERARLEAQKAALDTESEDYKDNLEAINEEIDEQTNALNRTRRVILGQQGQKAVVQGKKTNVETELADLEQRNRLSA